MDNLRKTLQTNKKHQQTVITFTFHPTNLLAPPNIKLADNVNEEVRVLRTKSSQATGLKLMLQ